MRDEALNVQRDVRLAGTLHLPAGAGPHPALVVLHLASGGERSHPFYQHLTTRLPAAGIAVALYDRRGAGKSGGNFDTADFETLAADGVAVADALAARPDIDARRIGVYGISQGSWLAPIVAARRPATACLVVVSGSGVSPARQMDYATARELRSRGFGEAAAARLLHLRCRVNEYYRGRLLRAVAQAELAAAAAEPWFDEEYVPGPAELPEDVTRSKWYLEMDYDPLAIWRDVRVPTLFVFPDDDRWVPLEESKAAYDAATAHLPDRTIVTIPGSDHLMGLESEPDPQRVASVYMDSMLTWLATRLAN
jgi:pimeloyl-ACP methyl ester carboxylesterase